MTLLEWKKSKSRTFAEIAQAMGYKQPAGTVRVWQHANFKRGVTSEDAQRYIKISKGKITLADLLKRPINA